MSSAQFAGLAVVDAPVNEESSRPVAISPNGEWQEVYKEAQDILGYRLPVPESVETRSPLAETLRALDCQVFTPESVDAYKAKVMSKNLLAHRILGFRIGWHAMWKEVVLDGGNAFVSFILAALLGAVIGALTALALWLVCGVAAGAAFGWSIGAGLSLALTIWAYQIVRHLTMSEQTDDRIRRRFAKLAAKCPRNVWSVTSLRTFASTPVPPQVLALALEVRKECSHVKFTVHYTTEKILGVAEIEQAAHQRWSDPFLVAELGNESYFIAVWDEADYRVCKRSA